MKIITLKCYSIAKDGGTKLYYNIEDEPKSIDEVRTLPTYYLDNRIHSNTIGELYDRYPSDEGAKILDKTKFNFLN